MAACDLHAHGMAWHGVAGPALSHRSGLLHQHLPPSASILAPRPALAYLDRRVCKPGHSPTGRRGARGHAWLLRASAGKPGSSSARGASSPARLPSRASSPAARSNCSVQVAAKCTQAAATPPGGSGALAGNEAATSTGGSGEWRETKQRHLLAEVELGGKVLANPGGRGGAGSAHRRPSGPAGCSYPDVQRPAPLTPALPKPVIAVGFEGSDGELHCGKERGPAPGVAGPSGNATFGGFRQQP